jgi:hypothetical protein
VKKLTHAALAALSFFMVLSGGLVAKTEQSEAVTYLVQGTNYRFTDNIGALKTFTGNGGVIKVSYYASCTYGVVAGGYWEARLQKQTSSGGWIVVDDTANVACTTYKKVGTLSFGTVPRGTYRLQFKKVSRSGMVTIHSFGAYRA